MLAQLIDSKSGEEVSTPEEIKRVSLEYCKALLTNRKPKDDFAEDILMKELVHNVRMLEKVDDDMDELSIEKFNKTYDILTKKPGTKYDFIVKGGSSMKAALFKLCQAVWRTEDQPDSWCKSTLVQCYKGKGPRTVLDNMRHLHMKEETPKFFGHFVMSEAKEKMTANMTKFQIGTKPGHRAQEHLFVLKSVISLYMELGKPIILSMWDVSKLFVLHELYNSIKAKYKENSTVYCMR